MSNRHVKFDPLSACPTVSPLFVILIVLQYELGLILVMDRHGHCVRWEEYINYCKCVYIVYHLENI